ncbi:hypothetical protein D3C78_1074020 [compost metagenome]
MGRVQGDGLAQVAQGVLQGLVGQAMHQVQVEVVEPGLTGHAGGTYRFIAVVDSSQGLEFLLLETLDTDRQAIDAQRPIGDELLLFEGARVGFQGNFDIAGERDALLHAFEQPAQCLGTEQARRAATEEDRAQFAAIDGMQVLVEVGQQGVDILFFRQHYACGVGVEVAIRAFAYAPRDVDVQRQGRQCWQRGPRRGCGAAEDQRRRGGVVGHFRLRRWRSNSIARARWLSWFFSVGPSSALEQSRSGTQNSGS